MGLKLLGLVGWTVSSVEPLALVPRLIVDSVSIRFRFGFDSVSISVNSGLSPAST
jgi:hypothetical protein